MRNLTKKAVTKLSVFIPLTIILMTIFSLPLMGIPPLGDLLFPGNGTRKISFLFKAIVMLRIDSSKWI